jgi:hypothetical protein
VVGASTRAGDSVVAGQVVDAWRDEVVGGQPVDDCGTDTSRPWRAASRASAAALARSDVGMMPSMSSSSSPHPRSPRHCRKVVEHG